MSNIFVALPQPAGNGAGAGVSTAALGSDKSIVVGSSGGVYEPITNIEVSNDGVNWSPIATFTGPATRSVLVSCAFMRMNVSRFVDGIVPTVDVGGPSDSVVLAVLAPTAGNGSSPSLDTTLLGLVKTAQVTGTFRGTVNVEISNDGPNGPWATVFTFIPGGPSVQTALVPAERMRVTRSGVPVVSPGLPIVVIAATDPEGGGGGSDVSAFVYTATGAEGAVFTLVLPQARGTTSYVATATDGGRVDGTLSGPFVCPIAQYTKTTIQVECPQAPAAGDKIIIQIQDTTS